MSFVVPGRFMMSELTGVWARQAFGDYSHYHELSVLRCDERYTIHFEVRVVLIIVILDDDT